MTRQHSSARTVGLALLVSAVTVVTACGSSTTKPVSVAAPTSAIPSLNNDSSDNPTGTTSASPSGSASSPAPTSPPTHHYLAVCNGTEIDYFDSVTGTPLYQQSTISLSNIHAAGGATDPSGARGSFSATGSQQVGGLSPFSCADYSFNNDLTKLAGLDTYPSGDVVPATLDLSSGTVTDAVPPLDHSGFTATAVRSYVYAAFTPTSQDFWSIKADEPAYAQGAPGSKYTVIGAAGYSQTSTYNGNPDPTISLVFGLGASSAHPPTISMVSDAPVDLSINSGYYLDSSSVPATNYQVQAIRRPDSGAAGGAFIAYKTSTSPAELFLLPRVGATPKQIATVPASSDPTFASGEQVIRYADS